jgi:hypothetical protein
LEAVAAIGETAAAARAAEAGVALVACEPAAMLLTPKASTLADAILDVAIASRLAMEAAAGLPGLTVEPTRRIGRGRGALMLDGRAAGMTAVRRPALMRLAARMAAAVIVMVLSGRGGRRRERQGCGKDQSSFHIRLFDEGWSHWRYSRRLVGHTG